VALAAVLVLAVTLGGCGARGRGDRTNPTNEQPAATSPASDMSDVQASLDELDSMLGQADQALSDADATPADED
jgi:hypothetical protein